MPHSPSGLRVASYNIRKGIGLDRRRRPERALEVMSHLGAQIIAVQEADRRLGNRPAALTAAMVHAGSDFVPVQVANNDVSLGWHGNALLVHKGLQVADTQRLELPGLEPRGAILVDLDGPLPLTIVATHLGLMRQHRTAQLQAILTALSARPYRPTIILGDFNEWSNSRGMEPLENLFTVHRPGKSYHASRPVAALDRIALSRDLTLRDAGVEERGQARIASDHLPVWGDIGLA